MHGSILLAAAYRTWNPNENRKALYLDNGQKVANRQKCPHFQGEIERPTTYSILSFLTKKELTGREIDGGEILNKGIGEMRLLRK
jgi:hypothetical protein